MERDKRRLKESKSSEEEKTDPQPIQEYEFFVCGSIRDKGAAPLKDRDEKGTEGKNGEPNKSGIFFSSGDEKDH
jgi:hypothetical protein